AAAPPARNPNDIVDPPWARANTPGGKSSALIGARREHRVAGVCPLARGRIEEGSVREVDRTRMNATSSGRHALVTGGTSGIGRAIARALRAEGCEVTVTGRTEAEVEVFLQS